MKTNEERSMYTLFIQHDEYNVKWRNTLRRNVLHSSVRLYVAINVRMQFK